MKRRVELGSADLADGELRGIEPEGTDRLVLLAKVGETYRAIDDWCNHAGCLLSAGWMEKRPDGSAIVVCPCHEIGFDLATGKNATSPEIAGDQEPFSVNVEDGVVYVELPDVEEK